MKTLIIIPTYNERENIEALARQITSVNPEFHVLVVDDHSPDGTGSIVQSLGEQNCCIHLLSRPSKQGLGGAYLAGFAYAIRHDFENIVTMDADFSHDPLRLESIVKSALQSDVAIGSRYTAGGRIENWPWLRRQLSLTANRLARCAVCHEIGDWTSGYLCYRRHVIEMLPIESLRSNGYSFLVEVLAACLQLGYRVTEVPITFCDRRSGRSKLSRVEIFKGMLTLLRLGMKRIFSAGVFQR
jgi:glycosyltransferase involved in cell wall biosynthesis